VRHAAQIVICGGGFLSYNLRKVYERGCIGGGPPRFPHPCLDDQINRDFIRSEIEGGVYLEDLPDGTELEIRTENRCYRLLYCGQGQVLISGHPKFCPKPVLVKFQGSTWGGSLVRLAYIGRGMRLEFRHPEHQTIITSPIVEIKDAAAS
jgi:hypothetical protein